MTPQFDPNSSYSASAPAFDPSAAFSQLSPEESAALHAKAGFSTGQGTPDTRNAFQRAADASVQPEQPLDKGWLGQLESAYYGVPQGVEGVVAHPLQAVQGMASAFAHPLQTGENVTAAARANPMLTAGQALGSSLAMGPMSEFPGFKMGEEGPNIGGAATRVKAAGADLFPALIDGPPESLMTRAVKPGKNDVGWNTDVQRAIPLMKSSEQDLGRPIQGVDDALDAAKLAKQKIWQQYTARLGPAAQMGATIDGNVIADAMMNSVDKRTATQNPALVQHVKAIADTYRHPISLSEAEEFLQSANKDLNTFYAKNKVGRQVAINDPSMASTVAEGDALRNALYQKLDSLTGPGAAQLKQAYGSLTNVEKELYGRQLVAARQNPESLAEQLSTARGAGRIAKGVLTANPGDVVEGVQNIAVAKALKARNTSDAMITRAFAKAQPAQPFPMPVQIPPRGFLPRGAIQIQGGPESAAVSDYQAPAYSPTTRAQRMGRMLPAESSAPVELPYYPQMTPDEHLAALMHLLRNGQAPPALPAQASPILLPPPR